MDAYISMFLEFLEDVRGCSTATIKNYECDLRKFSKSVTKEIEDIKKADIQKFIIDQKKESRSARTINRRLDCLSTFYEYLIVELELDLKKPIRREYKQKIKDRHSSRANRINPDDAARLMKYVKPLDKVAYLTMMLMGKAGLRISEARKLKLENIDFTSNQIMIIGSKGDDRVVPLAQSVKQAILEYVDKRSTGFLLIWSEKTMEPYTTNTGIWKKIRKLMDRVGVPGSPHSWRRMFGTELYKKTRDIVKVQQILGHKSIETTRGSYIDVADETEKDRLIFDDIF